MKTVIDVSKWKLFISRERWQILAQHTKIKRESQPGSE